jgi:hypothetical protein
LTTTFSTIRELNTIQHRGPSTIGIDTLYRSQGNIPEVFLRGAGVPEEFIIYIKSVVGRPFEYYSCSISSSSQDNEFAQRLYNDLQAIGIRCWFAPADLRIGDEFLARIDEAIKLRDKLLVVLSRASIQSQWVKKEVEIALEEEHRRKANVLFPIRLDDAVMETDQGWLVDLRRTRQIADFRGWKEHSSYQQAFSRLYRDLAATSVVEARERGAR